MRNLIVGPDGRPVTPPPQQIGVVADYEKEALVLLTNGMVKTKQGTGRVQIQTLLTFDQARQFIDHMRMAMLPPKIEEEASDDETEIAEA